jgi:hypothetical protein
VSSKRDRELTGRDRLEVTDHIGEVIGRELAVQDRDRAGEQRQAHDRSDRGEQALFHANLPAGRT